ncbi:hypothetical protein M3D91_011180, partial [Micrococcus luteus]|nr:hypothetical protein [Micrococcus luteus]
RLGAQPGGRAEFADPHPVLNRRLGRHAQTVNLKAHSKVKGFAPLFSTSFWAVSRGARTVPGPGMFW